MNSVRQSIGHAPPCGTWDDVSQRGGDFRCSASPPPTDTCAYQRARDLLQPSPQPLGLGWQGKGGNDTPSSPPKAGGMKGVKEGSWKDAILTGYSSRSPTARIPPKRRSSTPGTITYTFPMSRLLVSFATPSASSTPTPARQRASMLRPMRPPGKTCPRRCQAP